MLTALVKSLYFVFCTKYLNITLRSKRGLCYNLSRRWGWGDDRMTGSGEGPVLLHPLLRHGVARHVGVVDTALWNIQSQWECANMPDISKIYYCVKYGSGERNIKCDKCVLNISLFQDTVGLWHFVTPKVTRLWGNQKHFHSSKSAFLS